MDRLRQRLRLAEQAAETLGELAARAAPSKIERDAAIQRFEYTLEATWKAAQRFLSVVEGVEAGSPKSAVRGCHEAGLPRRVSRP
ncbi:MAG TPA: nucleotidyltransferase substrate binding protein [Candidatus Bathyarchaeia archaeon]|nr:nucleotidyltransferase substrate binding protein [Candidatus Bathyarchaeia archaeon]